LSPYAVITGDLVKSSTFKEKRKDALRTLHEIFNTLKSKLPIDIDIFISDIFRGDSFQIVVSDAEYALTIAIFIRAQLIRRSIEGMAFDARFSIGIGSIEYLNQEKITESDGEAFRLSGRSLDEIPNYRRLIITSSKEEQTQTLEVLSAFIDAITARWTPEQAEAISHWIFGETQTSLAKRIGVTQSAIQQRLQLAGHFAIEACVKYFDLIVHKYK
jgi:hypothetical protein